jgi:excisionase family DNA binding protein
MPSNTPEPITTTIGDFCRLTGLGRSTIYELLGDGRLDSVKIGKRRLILLDSYRRLIERKPGTPTPTALRRMNRLTASPKPLLSGSDGREQA